MASKQSATSNTPPSAPSEGAVASPQKTAERQAAELRALFMNMAIQMSWQLALVVVVPIVGGYMLDGHYHTAPWLLVIGLVVAAVGTFGVLRRVLTEANRRSSQFNIPKGSA
jgi:F0F1-type ATP synthase assembly protein I